MALYIVADECIACSDCEPVCPTNSITEKGSTFIIDKKTCTECEGDFDKPQCVRVCPIDNCILPLEA
jgi:ferredoxin